MKTKKIRYSKFKIFDNCITKLSNLNQEQNQIIHIVNISHPGDKEILFKKINGKHKNESKLLIYKNNILAKYKTELEIWRTLKGIIEE